MAPLGLVLLLLLVVVVEQEVEVDALGRRRRRREGKRGRHELLLLLLGARGGEGFGAHDDHLALRGGGVVVLGQAVEEAAGGAVLAEPTREVHAGPPGAGAGGAGDLGVTEREAAAVGGCAACRGPAVVVVGEEGVCGGGGGSGSGAVVVVPERVVGGGEGGLVLVVVVGWRWAPGRGGLVERAEHGRGRGGRLGGGGEVGARGGDEGVEEVVGAEGEADELLVAVVLDEQQAHDLGRVVRVQRAHPVEHRLGGLPGVHGVAAGRGGVVWCGVVVSLLPPWLLERKKESKKAAWEGREGERKGERSGAERGQATVGVKKAKKSVVN